MKQSFLGRLSRAWDIFTAKEPRGPTEFNQTTYYRNTSSVVQYSTLVNKFNILAALFNKIAIDASMIPIRHIQMDGNGKFKEYITSGLDDALNTSANIDETGKVLMRSAILNLFEMGHVAVIPTITDIDPHQTDGYDIVQLRVGYITEWSPYKVKVNVYNHRTGERTEVYCNKEDIAIIENPFYLIMNEPNSTLKRLLDKMRALDVMDSRISAGKIDMLIQLPYAIKSELHEKRASERRTSLEAQLEGAQYGIGYIDAAERVIQLNRPVDPSLVTQVENLTRMLFSQLGFSDSILNGTADSKTLLNYYNSIIEPLLSNFTDEYKRKFLTKTARTKGQTLRYLRDPFKLVPIDILPDMADKMTRNEILSPNEVRTDMLGFKPSLDPEADKLRNRNINQAKQDANSKSTSETSEVSSLNPDDLLEELLSEASK